MPTPLRSMYSVHDDIKEKTFELEISWVCDESGKKHTLVPADLKEAAEKAAKEAKEAEE